MVDYVIASDNGNHSRRLSVSLYEANYPPHICCYLATGVRSEVIWAARHGLANREGAAQACSFGTSL